MCVDLHTHSVYSDGTSTPAELISMATAEGLQALALTDHDTVEGVQETAQLGKEQGVEVISGLEFSARHGDIFLHILGYGIDPNSRELNEGLARLQQGRNERNIRMIEKLVDLGIFITREEIEQISGCGQTGRPHIARLLVAKGYVTTTTQAFERYLGRDKAAWCSRFTYSAAETIAIIHQAGGVAILAHPGTVDPGMKIQPRIIRELAERHLDGVEVYYPGYTQQTINRFKNLAEQHRLIVTGGSDYHGDSRIKGLAGKDTGICPPDSILDDLYDRIRQRNAAHF